MDIQFEKRTSILPADRMLDPETETILQKEVEKLLRYIVEHQIDSVVFLDISTRPIAYIFRRMWDNKYQGQPTESQPKKPDISFINIGTELLAGESHEGEEVINAYTLLREAVIHQRRLKLPNKDTFPIMTRETVMTAEQEAGIAELPSFTKKVEDAQRIYRTKFDGKSVLLVDENFDTGTSIAFGIAVLQRAFPDIRSIQGCWLRASEATWFRKGIGVTDNPSILGQLTHSERSAVIHQSELLARSIRSTKTREEYRETITALVRKKPECLQHIKEMRDNVNMLAAAVQKFEHVIDYVFQYRSDHPNDAVSQELSNIVDKNAFFDYVDDIQKVKTAVDFFTTTHWQPDALSELETLEAYRCMSFAYYGMNNINNTMIRIKRAMAETEKPIFFEETVSDIEQQDKFVSNIFDRKMARILDLFDDHLNDDLVKTRTKRVRENLQFIADTADTTN